jgi:hypothetical protein
MHDEFDTLIDNAVKSYAVAEPSPELATVILRRAQQEPLQRHNPWKLAMALALPFAAIAVITLLLVRPFAMPPAPPAVATTPAPPKIQAPPVLAKAATEPVPARAHVSRAETALATLRPLPIKFSRQDLVLVSFVQNHPKEAALIAEAQKQDAQPLSQQPITISRLRIAPLTISALNPED